MGPVDLCPQHKLLFRSFEQSLMQALDGGEGDAMSIYTVDNTVIVPDSEGGSEVLRHGADVLTGVRILPIAPLLDRQFCQPLENGP